MANKIRILHISNIHWFSLDYYFDKYLGMRRLMKNSLLELIKIGEPVNQFLFVETWHSRAQKMSTPR